VSDDRMSYVALDVDSGQRLRLSVPAL
jgi:hypothetical protein